MLQSEELIWGLLWDLEAERNRFVQKGQSHLALAIGAQIHIVKWILGIPNMPIPAQKEKDDSQKITQGTEQTEHGQVATD